MTKNLSKSLIAQRKKSEPFRKTLYGSLGIPLNGAKLVQVPNRQSYVYVRLNDNENEVIQAFNNTVSPSYDLPVVVAREGGRYTVKQVNTQRYENNWNNSSPYLPAHGTAHSFFPGGGADISWIYSRQIMHGLVYPTVTGTTLDIASFPLYTPNGWVLAGATGTVNLLQYRPVSGSASLMALLYADASNGNPGLLVNSGSYIDYSITGSVYPYIPRPNLATQIPLAAIRISTGTLNIGWDNLYDVRQWIHAIPSGSSSGGGGGGGIDTIGFAGLSNGVPLGTGTMMNVHGGGATFTISGSMFDLNIPTPIDTLGFAGLYNGVPLGTGTSMNVDGNANFTISGSRFNLSVFPDGWYSGGRLTLVSGTPVTTTDITGSNTVYLTPLLNNTLLLWDGTIWKPMEITQVPLPLGTMSTGTGYDIFAYISGTAVVLEKLAWTNSTTRATAVTLQDGRYCKSGDKTRLYLGSLYSLTSTLTSDSDEKRFLWNMYNRRLRRLVVTEGTVHNYNVNTARPWNNNQANADFEYFVGMPEDGVEVFLTPQITRIASDGNPRSSFGVNSIVTEFGNYGLAITSVGRTRAGSSAIVIPSLGYSYICVLEASSAGTAPGATFETVSMNGVIWA